MIEYLNFVEYLDIRSIIQLRSTSTTYTQLLNTHINNNFTFRFHTHCTLLKDVDLQTQQTRQELQILLNLSSVVREYEQQLQKFGAPPTKKQTHNLQQLHTQQFQRINELDSYNTKHLPPLHRKEKYTQVKSLLTQHNTLENHLTTLQSQQHNTHQHQQTEDLLQQTILPLITLKNNYIDQAKQLKSTKYQHTRTHTQQLQRVNFAEEVHSHLHTTQEKYVVCLGRGITALPTTLTHLTISR